MQGHRVCSSQPDKWFCQLPAMVLWRGRSGMGTPLRGGSLWFAVLVRVLRPLGLDVSVTFWCVAQDLVSRLRFDVPIGIWCVASDLVFGL